MISGQPQDFNLVEWWNCVPMFSRLVFYISTILVLLNILHIGVDSDLIDFPTNVLNNYEVYRMFTAPFVSSGLIGYVCSMILYLIAASREERRKGTCAYAWRFFLISKA